MNQIATSKGNGRLTEDRTRGQQRAGSDASYVFFGVPGEAAPGEATLAASRQLFGGAPAYDGRLMAEYAMATSSEPWRLNLLDVQASSGTENTVFARIIQGTAVVFCAIAVSLSGGQATTSPPTLASRAVEIAVPVSRRRREEDAPVVDEASHGTDLSGVSGASESEADAVTAGEQAALVQGCLGITRSAVAELLGVSRPTLHSWLKGEVLTPRSEVSAARLRLLHDLAVAWSERGGQALREWMNVRVPGGTLRQLLTARDWDKKKIERALDAIAAHQERQQAQRVRDYALRATVPSGNELDERARNRQTLRQIRRFGA